MIRIAVTVLTMTSNLNEPPPVFQSGRTLFSFTTADEVKRWYPINDNVMGGVSDGRVEHAADGALRFVGAVSLENNGGFASVRSHPTVMDLSDCSGILVRVRGDGQHYAFNVQTDYRIRAGSYRHSFVTVPDTWIEIYFPFSEFRATSFGVELEHAPPLNRSKIEALGLLISGKQVGPFSLEVDWIRAVSTAGHPRQ